MYSPSATNIKSIIKKRHHEHALLSGQMSLPDLSGMGHKELLKLCRDLGDANQQLKRAIKNEERNLHPTN